MQQQQHKKANKPLVDDAMSFPQIKFENEKKRDLPDGTETTKRSHGCR
jgi:hypothetical protein